MSQIFINCHYSPFLTDCKQPHVDYSGNIYLYFTSYYEFNTHGVACGFNREQEKQDKGKMLALFAKLDARLAEINEGNFTVEDSEPPRVMAL